MNPLEKINIIANIGNSEANIYGNPFTVLSLSIFVDTEERNKGISRVLLTSVIDNLTLKLENIGFHRDYIPNVLLHIDTDASWNDDGKSFWEYIGMIDARYANRKSFLPYWGYEKEITIEDIKKKNSIII